MELQDDKSGDSAASIASKEEIAEDQRAHEVDLEVMRQGAAADQSERAGERQERMAQKPRDE